MTVRGREGGREEFVNKGEKDKIRTNRNSVEVTQSVVEGWVVQAEIPGIPATVCLTWPQFLPTILSTLTLNTSVTATETTITATAIGNDRY